MRNDPSITCELVRSIYDYNQDTGVLTYKEDRGAMKKGQRAGTYKRGYLNLNICGKFFQGARVVWLHVHGRWPTGEIDHINRIPSDNRVENLRDVSHRVNMLNQRSTRANNKTGVVGVYYFTREKRFHAQISIKGKMTHLGAFINLDDAAKAYAQAKATHHAIPA